MKKVGSYFYHQFFDKELTFQYRLSSIFYIESFILALLSFPVNLAVGTANIGVFVQGFSLLFMIVVFFLPLKMKQRILPPLLIAIIFAYIPFQYFLYGGYDGSVLYFVSLSIFLLAFLYQGKVRIALVVANIAITISCIVLQTSFPELVAPIADQESRITDLLFAVVYTLFGMFALAAFVNNAYENERLRNIYLMNELKESSIRDALTGTFNRRYLSETATEVLKRTESEQRSACFLMLDIDHFKKINDTFGHLCGDEILINVASVIQQQLRKQDILARYGGEEFIIILYPETLTDAIAIAERIRTSVTSITLPDGQSVTASIGVVQSTPGVSVDEVYQQADMFLYQAKNNGRNRVECPQSSNAVSS